MTLWSRPGTLITLWKNTIAKCTNNAYMTLRVECSHDVYFASCYDFNILLDASCVAISSFVGSNLTDFGYVLTKNLWIIRKVKSVVLGKFRKPISSSLSGLDKVLGIGDYLLLLHFRDVRIHWSRR